jgi:hypothetical protein
VSTLSPPTTASSPQWSSVSKTKKPSETKVDGLVTGLPACCLAGCLCTPTLICLSTYLPTYTVNVKETASFMVLDGCMHRHETPPVLTCSDYTVGVNHVSKIPDKSTEIYAFCRIFVYKLSPIHFYPIWQLNTLHI